jgi:hypothetical protein
MVVKIPDIETASPDVGAAVLWECGKRALGRVQINGKHPSKFVCAIFRFAPLHVFSAGE